MANKLSLDLSDPAMAEAVKDCKPGDTKTFTVTVTAEVHDDTQFVGNVDEIEYSDAATDDEGEEEAAPPGVPGATEAGGNAIMLVLKKK